MHSSSDDQNETTEQPNQSVWVAHWTRTTCKSATPAHQLPIHYNPPNRDDVNTRIYPLLSSTSPANLVGMETKDNIIKGLIINPNFPMFNLSDTSSGYQNKDNPTQSYSEQGFTLPKFPSSVNDMRLCTAIDSVEDLSTTTPFISQTTHHLFISKKTHVNLSQGSQMLWKSMTSNNKLKGKMIGNLLSLSPNFSFQVPRVVETSAVKIRNESSAETDTMDMNLLDENRVSGGASSSSSQVKLHNSPKTKAAADSVGEQISNAQLKKKVPHINLQLPATTCIASTSDGKETSTSRTRSLDLFSNIVEEPDNSRFQACKGELGPNSSSRWVKRLKLTTSDSFSCGTKSLKMREISSEEKGQRIFGKLLQSVSTPNSTGKQPMVIDQTKKCGSLTSGDIHRSSEDITLSHSWIQRWCVNKQDTSPQAKSQSLVICEPKSLKATLDDELQKKQFPSAAAMALMGKTLTGFHACEYTKKGPVLVWNT